MGIAIHYRQMAVIKLLVTKGASVIAPDVRGYPPLMHAASVGDSAIIEYLLKNGAKVDDKGNTRHTPLHQATDQSHLDAVVTLLKHGADPNAKGSRGNTPLHFAVNNGNVDLIKILLDKGADPYIKNSKNSDVFAIAKSKKKHIAEYLNQYFSEKSNNNNVDSAHANKDELPNEDKAQNDHSAQQHKEDEENKVTELDPYKILGVTKDTSTAKIKQAYYALMKKNHPDKVDKTDQNREQEASKNAALIIWAYEILSNNEKRNKWDATHDVDEENATDKLNLTTETKRLSASYEAYFQLANFLFQVQPLTVISEKEKNQVFVEMKDLYDSKIFGERRYQYLYYDYEAKLHFSNVYQFVNYMAKKDPQPTKLSNNFLSESLNPHEAINLLLFFLEGKLYGENLHTIQQHYQEVIKHVHPTYTHLLTFYTSIQTIISITDGIKDYQKILMAIENIYAYAYQYFSDDILKSMVMLMHNQYFRYFVADVNRHYWQDVHTPFDPKAILKSLKNTYLKKYKSKGKIEKIFLGLEKKCNKP